MKYVYIALLFVALHGVACMHRLDALDRSTAWLAFTNRDKFLYVNLPPRLALTYFIRMIQIPLKDRLYFARMSEGALYGVFSLVSQPALCEQMDSKVMWAKTFEAHGIRHPKTIAYKSASGAVCVDKICHQMEYVAKPDRGGLGIGVRRVSGAHACELLQSTSNLLIQESITDCSGYARHFRYVTLCDGTQFALYELRNRDAVASNHNNKGSSVTRCVDMLCPGISASDQNALNTLLKQLLVLHMAEFRTIFSIGWDIMLKCKNGVAYALEGNVSHTTWYWPELVEDELLMSYRRKLVEHLSIARSPKKTN